MNTFEAGLTHALCAHLWSLGFEPFLIGDDDWDRNEWPASPEGIVQFARDVDVFGIEVAFRRRDANDSDGYGLRETGYWAVLIPGNGPDLLSDWSVPAHDPYGWNRALEAFCDRNILQVEA